MRCARELLVAQGIDRFTVAEVAQASQLSKPSLYYYFESKEALVFDLAVETLTLELAAVADAVQPIENGIDALVSLVRTRVDFYLKDTDAFRIVHVWSPALGVHEQLLRSSAHEQMGALLAGIGERLGAQQKNGTGRAARPDIHQLPQMAWALSQGILVQGLSGAASPKSLEPCRAMRDVACRWLLDSLV
jgi:AcrR family transcriptional regulator